jgi:hypothetical protein
VSANALRPKKQRVDWKRAVATQDAGRQVVKAMDDRRWDVWQAFAEANGLTLTRHIASLSNDIHISGEYRGHNLVFEIRMAVSEVHIGGNTTTIRAVLTAHTSEKRTEALMRQLAELTPPNVLNVLTASGFSFLPGTFAARDGGKCLSYEESTDVRESDKLRRIANGLGDLAEGYPAVVAAGGAAAPALQALVKEGDLLRGVIIQILKDIAQATQHLGGRTDQLLCPRCLARCGPHRADLPWQPDVTYYGCRICHQSREFIECPQGSVAVLNAAWRSAQALHNGSLGINWLARRALFDFDRVEIVRATDKDVEHFAMQVGNDTDPLRKPRYATMRCVVNPACGLSENTLRVLENTFGRVDAWG